MNQGVTGSIAGQGAYLGCKFDFIQGMYRRQQVNVFLSPGCFSFSLKSNERKKSLGKDKKNILKKEIHDGL